MAFESPTQALNALAQTAGIDGSEANANIIELWTRWIAAGLTLSDAGVLGLSVAPVFSAANLTSIPTPSTIAGFALADLVAGDLLYSAADDTLTRLAKPSANRVLTHNGTIPVWALLANANIDAAAAIAYSKLNLADAIVNADINSAAAIAYSKLNLAAAIVNADIATAAAIAYSKLNLGDSIVNADINSAAAIALSKLATVTASKLLGAGSAGNTAPAEITLGTGLSMSGTTLNADTTLPTGTIKQVVTATHATETSSSSSTYADTGLTASITLADNTNKVLVIVFQAGCAKTTADTELKLKLLRGSTDLAQFELNAGENNGTTTMAFGASGITYLDSPASASALTYKTQFASVGNTGAALVQWGSAVSSIALLEVVA